MGAPGSPACLPIILRRLTGVLGAFSTFLFSFVDSLSPKARLLRQHRGGWEVGEEEGREGERDLECGPAFVFTSLEGELKACKPTLSFHQIGDLRRAS